MGALAFAAILLALGLNAIHHKADLARAQAHALDTKMDAVRKERQGFMTMMRQPQNAKVLAEAGRLNQLFDEKAFSWTLAIEDLETVLPGGIQVTTLEPNRSPNGTITLKLRVAGPRDRAIELVQNLEHSRHFAAPRIVGESAETSGGLNERVQPVSASSRVTFEILAEYIPPTVAEIPPGEKKQDTEANAQPGAAGVPPSQEDRSTQADPRQGGERRTPYLGMPRPKAPVQTRKGGAK